MVNMVELPLRPRGSRPQFGAYSELRIAALTSSIRDVTRVCKTAVFWKFAMAGNRFPARFAGRVQAYVGSGSKTRDLDCSVLNYRSWRHSHDPLQGGDRRIV